MANPDHVEMVTRGLKAFKKWREEYGFIKLELTDSDLRNINLNNTNLDGANLDGANLSGANLSGTNLCGANLCGANLKKADLCGADLTGGHLSNADLNDACLKKANLCNTDLRKTNFEGSDLSESLLCKANMSGANFKKTNLKNANLSESLLINANFNESCLTKASLSGADMSETNLREANLSWALLIKTNMSKADLEGASLVGANLRRTNMSESNLKNTDLNMALSWYTYWINLDLSQTIGLEKIYHRAPSSIGIDTLEKSVGMIPEIFLRGCGLSDDFISYIPSHFSGSAIEFYSCFISYSHEDKSFARRLHDALQGRGIRCWLDEHQILPGDNIYDRIEHGVRVWDKVLLCASKHSLTSGWVDDELKHAFAKEKQLFKERGEEVLSLIPLNLDGHLFAGWKHPKKNQILERLAADFTSWESDNEKFEVQFERVVKALQTKNSGREPDPIPKL
ncbi:Secreted effector protein pipB2 [Gimesia panareensis]|uniref:Secreted effector protein pipB2 n=1 Tax=Gimesia panareensis TaxID=2527978 RepID=A0A518FWE5_9PLAN|nr:toll/interleukin-1 receptor domain-containing protein [Gimesia panareensis]QDV20664.1 Secreted effector protein pipB2 [Gimesia panareensis]